MRVGGVGAEGRIGAGEEVFCSMQFLASINHGGRSGPTAAMRPYPAFEHAPINKHTRQQVSIIKTRKSYH